MTMARGQQISLLSALESASAFMILIIQCQSLNCSQLEQILRFLPQKCNCTITICTVNPNDRSNSYFAWIIFDVCVIISLALSSDMDFKGRLTGLSSAGCMSTNLALALLPWPAVIFVITCLMIASILNPASAAEATSSSNPLTSIS